MTKGVETSDGAEPGVMMVAIDGDAIAEIILSHGAPPVVAATCANAIVDYLVKVYRNAGATGPQ